MLLIGIALIVVSFSLEIWTLIPAPTNVLWQVALGTGEWGLWFSLASFIGLFIVWRAHALDARPIFRFALMAMGIDALGMGLVPLYSASKVGSLSLREYVLGVPLEKVRQTTEVFAHVGDQDLKVDIYSRAADSATQSHPAIIVIHGGSFRAGERSDFRRWDEWLANQGATVFDIDYRIAPQPNFPHAVADVKCAIGWVRKNATAHGVDPNRIALYGRSAGANLALLAAYSAGDTRLPASCEVSDTSVAKVISLYGSTDLPFGYAHVVNPAAHDGQDVLRTYLGGTPASVPDAYALASPITHADDAHSPPTLLFHGGHDQLISHLQMDRLQKALPTRARSIYLPYAQHGFDYNENGWGSQIVRTEVQRFLGDFLPPTR